MMTGRKNNKFRLMLEMRVNLSSVGTRIQNIGRLFSDLGMRLNNQNYQSDIVWKKNQYMTKC